MTARQYASVVLSLTIEACVPSEHGDGLVEIRALYGGFSRGFLRMDGGRDWQRHTYAVMGKFHLSADQKLHEPVASHAVQRGLPTFINHGVYPDIAQPGSIPVICEARMGFGARLTPIAYERLKSDVPSGPPCRSRQAAW